MHAAYGMRCPSGATKVQASGMMAHAAYAAYGHGPPPHPHGAPLGQQAASAAWQNWHAAHGISFLVFETTARPTSTRPARPNPKYPMAWAHGGGPRPCAPVARRDYDSHRTPELASRHRTSLVARRARAVRYSTRTGEGNGKFDCHRSSPGPLGPGPDSHPAGRLSISRSCSSSHNL